MNDPKPYASPKESAPSTELQAGRKSRAPLVMALVFGIGHALAMLAFASGNVNLAGPERDAGALAWALWLVVDTPISWFVFPIAEGCKTNAAAVTLLTITGSLQWALWGGLVGWIFSSVSRWWSRRR